MSPLINEIDPINIEIQGFTPLKLLDIEIGRPFQELSPFDPQTGRSFQRGLGFIFLHHQPLGMIELEYDGHALTAEEVRREVWQALHEPINQHLKQDGMDPITALDVNGIPASGKPECEQEVSNPPLVSVIICTRDHPESLALCLESLRTLDYPNFEIVLVDNAPATNATFELAQSKLIDLKNLRYVREDRPGLSAARNCGLAQARGEIIAYTDDDVIVDSQWLKRLVAGFSGGENVACVTGMVLPAEIETPAQAMMEQYGGMGKGFTQQIFDLDANRPSQLLFPFTAGAFGVGANMAFKTSILRSLGGFDPALGTGTIAWGGEDLAMFFNIVVRGHQIVYQPGAFIRHFHRRTYAAFQKQAYAYGVGLTAYLTKILMDQPGLLMAIALRIPAGIWYLLHHKSPKNIKKRANYPAEINRLERKGMLYGPVAYWRSHRQAQKYERQHALRQNPAAVLPAQEEGSRQ